MNDTRLMAHLVACYPDRETSLCAADALVAGGAGILEIQLAFSDPSADGTAIQTACASVLSNGVTMAQGFDFIAEVRRRHPEIPVFVMTYASLAFRQGIETFVRTAKEHGTDALIIPDLPFDCDEGLNEACAKHGIAMIPVAAPSMTAERLALMKKRGFQYIYAALRSGITGNKTVVTPDMIRFLETVSANGTRVLGGFGIENGEQVAMLAPHVYAVVAGSVFVRIIAEHYNAADISRSRTDIAEKLKQKAAELH